MGRAQYLNSTKRITGTTLQNIREQHFSRHPLCVHCLLKKPRPMMRPATQLDHKIPIAFGGPDVESNRQGLCDECHAIKTAHDFGLKHKPKVKVGDDGYPIIKKS